MPHVKTGWGKFSLVAAALRALELLYQSAAPDWFALLSAADKAGKLLKWQPKVPLREGLMKAIEYFEQLLSSQQTRKPASKPKKIAQRSA